MRRITIGFQDEVWEYLEAKAKSLGATKNAVVQLAVGRMKEQDQVMNFLSKLSADELKLAMEKMKDGTL